MWEDFIVDSIANWFFQDERNNDLMFVFSKKVKDRGIKDAEITGKADKDKFLRVG